MFKDVLHKNKKKKNTTVWIAAQNSRKFNHVTTSDQKTLTE